MQRQNSPLTMRNLFGVFGLTVLLTLVGCTDGIFHKMKSMNPYYLNQWEKDRQLGTTFTERIEEITLLRSRLPNMPPNEQEYWAELLEKLVKSDPSPEMRSLACQTVAMIPGEAASRALNTAAVDSSEKVRLMACAGLKSRGGEEARNMLLTMATNTSESPSVRRASIAALSNYNDDTVKAKLAQILDDKSPALQYQTALSLKSLTGKDYGGDIQSWRDFMGGKDVPEPEKSLMASFWDSMSFTR